jgi:hypothetical protein
LPILLSMMGFAYIKLLPIAIYTLEQPFHISKSSHHLFSLGTYEHVPVKDFVAVLARSFDFGDLACYSWFEWDNVLGQSSITARARKADIVTEWCTAWSETFSAPNVDRAYSGAISQQPATFHLLALRQIDVSQL